MTSTSLARRLARALAHALPTAGVGLTLARLAQGGFRGLDALGWWEVAAMGLLVAGVVLASARRVHREAMRAPPRARDDLELASCLVAAAYTLVAIAGAAFFPLIYLLVAALVSFLPLPSGLALVGLALGFDALVTLLPPPGSVATFATHAAFMLLFAALYHVVLRVRLLAMRRAESEAVKNRIREVEERARTFRLVSAGSQDRAATGTEDRDKWLLASVKEIEGAVGAALEVAEAALRTHTCAVFLLTSDDRALKLHDCRSQSERLQRDAFPAGEGLLGAVLKRRAPLRMNSARGLKGISYYEDTPPEVVSLLAVPIIERREGELGETTGHLRGVLVADRLHDEAFTAQDEKVLTTVAEQVLRAIEVERVMNYIRKSRDEKDRFFQAMQELNRAASFEKVFPAVLESAKNLANLDLCALTLVRSEGGKRVHRIVRVDGASLGKAQENWRALEGRAFEDNNGLVANVVRYGTPLPGRDFKSMDRMVIFDDDAEVRGLSALKIFPLHTKDSILGTLVAGSRRRSALDEDVLRMLEVIAMQAAQALDRARLYEKMERMATTDGLTGLLNHRTFQQKADELLAQARRYGRKCSLILTDVDHFKSVNDTYGHSTGDMVLKGVARILREQARDTDVVARYGGEEFCLVMPETDTRGAQVIAERIREAVRAESFQTELGPLRVTLSLGIATCPDNSADKQALIDLADQCLYHAKRNGRNQSVTVTQMQGGRRLREAEG